MFKLFSPFEPTGDQPKAIEKLTKNLKTGVKNQVLLGVTGSGKTMSMASVIEKIKKPVLVISPNKTLCAQLFQEFKEFFPKNRVHYFVSYYDYYQPEAYIPQTDTYIEKDAKINEEIDRLRHAATQDLLTRDDIIIVASVSCIYNIGSPETYQKVSLEISQGQKTKRKDFLGHLTSLQYQRNDIDFKPGTFRVRGDIIEIYLVTGKEILRIEFSGDQISSLWQGSPNFKNNYKLKTINYKLIYPAHFWVTPQEKLNIAMLYFCPPQICNQREY
ncbi:DEAD/DEAH box helicase family protein [Patescibacteria group bacterium]|nr:DEAD/DEAH box helicase family protein [Patescibacteria group bacterium]